MVSSLASLTWQWIFQHFPRPRQGAHRQGERSLPRCGQLPSSMPTSGRFSPATAATVRYGTIRTTSVSGRAAAACRIPCSMGPARQSGQPTIDNRARSSANDRFPKPPAPCMAKPGGASTYRISGKAWLRMVELTNVRGECPRPSGQTLVVRPPPHTSCRGVPGRLLPSDACRRYLKRSNEA